MKSERDQRNPQMWDKFAPPNVVMFSSEIIPRKLASSILRDLIAGALSRRRGEDHGNERLLYSFPSSGGVGHFLQDMY